MIKLYNSTNGPEWRNNENWLSDEPLYEWFGLTVNADGRVTAVRLWSNQLKGSLPQELTELGQLRTLSLEGNDLTGPIPHEIGLLPNLERLNLAYNNISGEIPRSLVRSVSLREINLGNNNLSGTIPSEFIERSQIRNLDLSYNQLNSEIPTEITRARNLSWLTLSYNQLTGGIPPGIAQLQNLARLEVSNNQLTGQLPDGLNELPQLQRLDIDGNQFTGTLPERLGELEFLDQLSVAGNDFSGCVPSDLRDVQINDIDFANIPVCGEPERTDPVIPSYIKLATADTAKPAQTVAVELAVHWLNDFIELIGLPAPENTITVHADQLDGLAKSYADHVLGCTLQCALSSLERRYQDPPDMKGAAFVEIRGTHGVALRELAERTARETFNALQAEVTSNPNTRGHQSDPRWWTYGLSTFVAELAIADGTGQSRDVKRQEIAEIAVDVQFFPLWELEKYGTWGGSNIRGAAAIDLLASQVGLRKLTDFYTERVSGDTWQQTFQRVFNISVPDFYERFNQHHRNGFPLRELPLEGSTDWPDQ